MTPTARAFPATAAGVRMLATALVASGCSTLIGLDGYTTRSEAPDGSQIERPVDASADTLAPISADSASCEIDASFECYACTPTQPSQFLNACTTATCVPFDDSVRLTNLLDDGGLPPLPVAEAGAD